MAESEHAVPPGSLLFLHGELGRSHNDNHLRLPGAFRERGWSVSLADHDSLHWQGQQLSCSAGLLNGFTRIWLLGLGRRASFLDRMQLLTNLPGTRFITRPDALLKLHGKVRWLEYMPLTLIAANADQLLTLAAAYENNQGACQWIYKPTAGSFGREVFQLPGGSELAPALQTLLKQRNGESEYLLLQRFEPTLAQGEIRVLWAGGRIIGCYQRLPGSAGTNNLSTGGHAVVAELSASQRRLATRIGEDLQQLGVGFAAIDVSGPFLVEINLANPGGIGTVTELMGFDAALAVADVFSDRASPEVHRR